MRSDSQEIVGKFTCNICGADNESNAGIADRELTTCNACRSSMRFRSIILVLSRALFGMDLKLRDFPFLKSVRGLGISDSDTYSSRLAEHFTYANTFYHREPALDLVTPDETEFGKYDFVICSEVLEHVPAPVERSFKTLAALLKPAGFLILTTPYSVSGHTVEHFADLQANGLVEIDGKMVLVNRAGDGKYEVFDQLSFHGGQGSTLEMRLFSEPDLRALLTSSGLVDIRFEPTGSRTFGVRYSGPCSLPIVASRQPFTLSASGIRELTEQLTDAHALLRATRESRWVRLGRLIGIGPELPSRRTD